MLRGQPVHDVAQARVRIALEASRGVLLGRIPGEVIEITRAIGRRSERYPVLDPAARCVRLVRMLEHLFLRSIAVTSSLYERAKLSRIGLNIKFLVLKLASLPRDTGVVRQNFVQTNAVTLESAVTALELEAD